MSKDFHMHRRNFLRGLGAAVALPILDSTLPLRALAGAPSAAGAPVRMAFLFVPNGMHMPAWTPNREGADFELPSILEPFAPLRDDLLVLSGLTHDKGRANGDGAGDHARSAATFLTGSQATKTEGAIRAGTSVDQFAAQMIGKQTRFPSVQLGAEGGRLSGQCDSGYSCAYSNNISWANETTPLGKATNPREVFERLFAGDLQDEVNENRARRQRYKKSILDFVLDDAKQLGSRVNGDDRRKLDEYLTAVREIEQRLERMEKDSRTAGLHAFDPATYDLPEGIPDSYAEHIRLMGDMMILAFQTDSTRIATFMLANEGSNKPYRFIGVNEGHHTLSHHQNDDVKLDKIRQINRFHAEQVAYILNKMKSIPEGDGTLLDNCMVVYGAGISDGNRHNNENLPVLVAGRGGGTLRTGRHIRYHQETPMSNLLLSMLDRVGVEADHFGDSTGRLPHLAG
jgi:hypothetical protein